MIKIIEYDPKYAQEVKDFIENLVVKEFDLHRVRPDLDNVLQVYAKPDGNFWLAIDENDRVIGTLGLQKYEGNRGYLRRMYVREDYRGTGLAQRMLEKLLALAQKNGYQTVFLDSSFRMKRAHHFYEKNGFYKIDHPPLDISAPEHQEQYFYERQVG